MLASIFPPERAYSSIAVDEFSGLQLDVMRHAAATTTQRHAIKHQPKREDHLSHITTDVPVPFFRCQLLNTTSQPKPVQPSPQLQLSFPAPISNQPVFKNRVAIFELR
jgi:hypothetical protein